MKYKNNILVTAVVLLLCLVTVTMGCNTGKEKTVLSMLRYIPENADNFEFKDVTAMQENYDLESFYTILEEDLWEFLRLEEISGGIIDEKKYEKYGIYSNDVGYSLCLRGNYYIFIIKGDFNFDQIIEELDAIDLETSEHLGVVIWEGFSTSIALTEDLIIMGNGEDIKDCIEVIKGENDSILENQEMKGLVDRLPDAPQIACSVSEEDTSWWGKDILGGGSSTKMLDDETARFTQVIMYINEGAAQNYIEELEEAIKEEMIDEDVTIINFHRDGRFTVITLERKV